MKHNKRMAAAMLAAVLSLNGAGAFAMQTAAAETQTDEYAVTDVVALHKFLMCKGKLSKDHHKKMDMTGDGVIDAFDLAVMKRKLIEKRRPAQQVENVQLRMESTRAVTKWGWYDAFEDEAHVFTSPDQFEELGSLVKAPVLRHLQKTYTAEFFEENVLCFKLMPVTDMQTLKVDTDAIAIGDTIEIPYSIADTAEEGKMVTAVELVLPKKHYREQEVLWKQKNEKPITVEYSTESLYPMNIDLTNAEALISTQAEMIEFLSSTLSEDGIADFKERYPASFFEEKSLHMALAYDGAPQYELAKAVKNGDTIRISLMKEGEYGMSSGFYTQTLRIAEMNKSDLEGAQLELKCFDGMCGPISDDAKYYSGRFRNQNLAVQYVDYAEETDVELFFNTYMILSIGADSFPHFIKNVPMQKGGYRPIAGEYTISEREENDFESPVTYEGKDFRMVWRNEGVCVQMKTSPDAETYEKVYIWENPYQGESFCEKHEIFYCEECGFEEQE